MSTPITSSPWKVGDQVWVKIGTSVTSSSSEELCTIISLPSNPTPATPASTEATKRRSRRSKQETNDETAAANGDDVFSEGILVKYSTSGYEMLVTEPDRIRPMEDNHKMDVDDSGRRLRRSGRTTKATSVLATIGDESATKASTKATTNGKSTNGSGAGKGKKSFAANAVSVTPLSTELDHPTEATSPDDIMEVDSKPAAKVATNKRKRSASAATAKAAATKKAKTSKAKSETVTETEKDDTAKKSSPYFDNSKKSEGKAPSSRGRGRKLILASSEEEGKDGEGGENEEVSSKTASIASKKEAAKKSPASADKGAKESNGEKHAASASAKKTTAKGGNGKAAKAFAAKNQPAAAAAKGGKKPAAKKAKAKANETTTEKKKAPRKRNTTDTGTDADIDTTDAATDAPIGNEPDGEGGLNQPSPWIVEYSKTGRATCRSCDEKIGKGEMRVGHTPLFRGKPGFMVYRHLLCAVFGEEIHCAEDVEGYDTLTDQDYVQLAEQVDVSKEKIKEEKEELQPDELVQKSFEGEIRKEPEGLMATLLPFQVEGFSWMRHQEVMEESVRGGILADEMGMGKTIQTIATILDHRPKLQHSKPGMKHPPTDDLKERQVEEQLWDKTKRDWIQEMELLKVPKKLRSRDGGARAGTLVICPVIALSQWKAEIEKFTEDGTLSVCTYHGPDRESVTPRELMKKYDVVLTTYQVLEADFRKMTSPNRVECPNCGGKFKIDKLPIHLKYFCGDNAERTEAQARQQRNSDRDGGGNRGRRGRRPANPFGRDDGGSGSGNKKDKKKKGMKKEKVVVEAKKKKFADEKKKKADKKPPEKKPKADKKPAAKKPAAKKPPKKTPKNGGSKKSPPESIPEPEPATTSPRARSGRSAARKAASQISQSAAEWMPEDGNSDSDNFQSDAESSDDDTDDDDNASDSGNESSSEDDYESDSSGDDSELERAREKQRQALEFSKSTKKAPMGRKKQPAGSMAKGKGKKSFDKKPAAKGKGKGKPKKFDDESDEDYSSTGDASDDIEDEIDMAALMEKAMAGAKNSVLHSLCWWRIILDEAHFIKTRSSQTANAAFSLIGVHRWCLSGTPLQNRVGEFYSLVRFLRLDPMAYYYCRAKDCNCKSMHYRIHAGICEGCGHSGIQHYSHFNKYVLNPIQRDGYSGDGRRAMFLLKNEVLDTALLRRTKETQAADMELPPRLVQIKPVRLHPVEEDFYSALYTQTKSSFDDYVDSGTLLNNYAHIFDLLIRMRQSVDHPYLVVYSKKNTDGRMGLTQNGDAPAIANGSVDCDLCHEPPTDRVVSTCCGAAYCRACVLEYMATTNSMAASANLTCPSCRAAFSIDLQARADIEDDSSLTVKPSSATGAGPSLGMPSLRELQHVATGSILRRINLAEFATSSKIEALTRELVLMRQTSPGSKAIVFSQFVNMLDLIRWRLHSDPYLEDIGLGCRALHGGMNVKARDACLKDFRENNNVRVLLMSLKAGGVALNLTCANYIYLMDPWWNPAAEMQAIDRTHRLGQYRPIRAVRFIAENTVEERILQLQEKKRLVFDGTVGRDAGSLKMLTVDDMKSLFA